MSSGTELRRTSWPYLAPEPEQLVAPVPPPDFTVVITAYNVGRFLAESIESVLAQTVAPAEIIVVDDGSTDDTPQVVAAYADRVRVIRRENGGEAAAKNTGWRAARTEWVIILDGDDLFAPERVEAVQWLASQRPDLDVIVTDLHEFGPQAQRALLHSFGSAKVFPVNDQRAVLLERAVYHVPAFRRSAMEAVGGMDEARRDIHADWEIGMRLALAGCRAGIVAAPLYRYRRWEGQSTSSRLRVVDGMVRTLQVFAADPRLTAAERDRNAELQRSAILEGWRLARTADPGSIDPRSRVDRCAGSPARARRCPIPAAHRSVAAVASG